MERMWRRIGTAAIVGAAVALAACSPGESAGRPPPAPAEPAPAPAAETAPPAPPVPPSPEPAAAATIEDFDFGNTTWQFIEGASAETPLDVMLVDGVGQVDYLQFTLGEEVVFNDANGDGRLDALVPISAYGGGNSVDLQWYIWVDSDDGPQQVLVPVAAATHCGTVIKSVTAAELGFEIHERRRDRGDEHLSCVEEGTDERVRTVVVDDVGPRRESWPIQTAPVLGFGGICPKAQAEPSVETDRLLRLAPEVAADSIHSPGTAISMWAVDFWPVNLQYSGWALVGFGTGSDLGCGWVTFE